MAAFSTGLPLLTGILFAFCSWTNAQAFLPDADGTVLTAGYPDSLSPGCQASFNHSTQCNSTLGAVAFDALFPTSDQLATICTDNCLESLQSFRSQLLQSCAGESYPLDGQLVPATYNADQLLFTYNYTCLKDPSTGEYCAPLVDQWSQDGPTPQQSCSDCMLRTFQVELNSPFAYDVEFANYYSSLTSSCGVLDYPITSPPPYTATATTTSSSVVPSTTSCASHYVIRQGDDCLSVSKALSVSTAMLRYENGLTADCSNFPNVGDSLCIPETCEIYTVKVNETCYGISEAYNATFTVTQLISWNPDINRDCSNLEAITGTQICISAAGDDGEPDVTTTTMASTEPVPAPTNVVNGTNLRCAKYYEVAPGDTCASVSTMMGISLSDFYFLNPEVDNQNCTNLLAGYSYCVQAVGDITTYAGYGCLATGPVTTDTSWAWPTYTTNITAVPTPLPLATGTLANCSAYTEYISPRRNTSTINTCYVVATFYDADVNDFVSWNPSLSYDPDNPTDCQLQPGYRYCAQLTGATATTTPVTWTTTSTQLATSTGPNDIPTPLPIQSGMTTSCNKFYLVQPNDSCYGIAATSNIALPDFYSWNPALNGDCSGLYPDYYVCVGLVSSMTTTTTTTTTGTGGAVATPTPTQAGMVSDCTKFYLVQSGDGCYNIAAAEGVALSDFHYYSGHYKSHTNADGYDFWV
ncbi:hypothetical protein CNMCM7691_005768 [Aspergillus felis]|uniref:LysM domain-containing protein n=1 Tax=Aspergillus felis TaxID=1287682 RepID=A0A8H6R3M9_9EURO|nr:hypothetical protein CNMCM7691_005768 [Aspergillus felis]